MAVVKHTGLIDELRGKLGGSVFQRNPGGQICRVGKLYHRTALYFNMPQTSITPSVSAGWKNLTPTQRATWQAQTINYPSTDKYGNPRTPSAYTLYVRINARLAALRLPLLSTASAPTSLTSIVGTIVGVGPLGPLTFTFPNTTTTEEHVIFEGTPAFSAGRSMPAGYWRTLKHQRVFPTHFVTVFPQWENIFHAYLSGLQIFFRLRVINKNNGQVSAPLTLSYLIP